MERSRKRYKLKNTQCMFNINCYLRGNMHTRRHPMKERCMHQFLEFVRFVIWYLLKVLAVLLFAMNWRVEFEESKSLLMQSVGRNVRGESMETLATMPMRLSWRWRYQLLRLRRGHEPVIRASRALGGIFHSHEYKLLLHLGHSLLLVNNDDAFAIHYATSWNVQS